MLSHVYPVHRLSLLTALAYGSSVFHHEPSCWAGSGLLWHWRKRGKSFLKAYWKALLTTECRFVARVKKTSYFNTQRLVLQALFFHAGGGELKLIWPAAVTACSDCLDITLSVQTLALHKQTLQSSSQPAGRWSSCAADIDSNNYVSFVQCVSLNPPPTFLFSFFSSRFDIFPLETQVKRESKRQEKQMRCHQCVKWVFIYYQMSLSKVIQDTLNSTWHHSVNAQLTSSPCTLEMC